MMPRLLPDAAGPGVRSTRVAKWLHGGNDEGVPAKRHPF
jgi:hypothetical protein